jgi:hypothetical protein
MTFTETDTLAINTIRTLAVSCPALTWSYPATFHLKSPNNPFKRKSINQNFKFMNIILIALRSRLMLPSMPTPAILVRQWAWHQSPMFSSTSF